MNVVHPLAFMMSVFIRIMSHPSAYYNPPLAEKQSNLETKLEIIECNTKIVGTEVFHWVTSLFNLFALGC